MRYYDLLNTLENGKIKDMANVLLASKKNKAIAMFRDYYQGAQWLMDNGRIEYSRSGKRIWEIKKKTDGDMGIGEGDVQMFNVCESSVSVYSSYARGTINDKNRVIVKDNPELTNQLNSSMNLDLMIARTIARSSVDSFACWKFAREDKVVGSEKVEFVDALELFPIYKGENKVGTIRIYQISPNDPILKNKKVTGSDKEDVLYMEIWYRKGETMWLDKYANNELLESGKAPYDFDPHIYVVNKNNEFARIDENNLEMSDIGNLIPMQDTLNKTLTEEGVIISKVAFPMIKVIKEVYDLMGEGKVDGEQLKQDLSEISLVAGKIISAPIERMDGQDIPNGVDGFINNIFAQIYRVTGIPKGVFVSEGMSGISEKTISAMMESLKRRIDEKRANFEEGIKQYVAMLVGDDSIMDKVSVEWAEMFAMSKKEMADVVIDGFTSGVLTREYALEELLRILGDAEKFEEIIKKIEAEDINGQINVEREKLRADSERVISAKDKELQKEREARVKSETEKTLLAQEMDNITSSL